MASRSNEASKLMVSRNIQKSNSSVLGIHMRKGKHTTLENAIKHTFMFYAEKKPRTKSMIKYAQINTHGPQNIRERRIDIEYLTKIMKDNDARIIVHSSSLTYPWKDTSYMWRHTFAQMKKSHMLSAYGIVIHLPKIEPKKIIPVLKILLNENRKYKKTYKTNTIIILEMISQKPSKYSYETPEKINALIAELKNHKITSRDIGICIDTAHIFVNHTEVDIRLYIDAKKYIKKIKYPTFIKLIHLNGNTRTGYSDSHTIPLSSDDQIWKKVPFKSSGALAFIEFAKKRHIPTILEMETQNPVKIKGFIRKVFITKCV